MVFWFEYVANFGKSIQPSFYSVVHSLLSSKRDKLVKRLVAVSKSFGILSLVGRKEHIRYSILMRAAFLYYSCVLLKLYEVKPSRNIKRRSVKPSPAVELSILEIKFQFPLRLVNQTSSFDVAGGMWTFKSKLGVASLGIVGFEPLHPSITAAEAEVCGKQKEERHLVNIQFFKTESILFCE